MKQSMKNIPSRDDINTAVNRFLEKGGQIERLGSVKPGYVTEMLDEQGWNNESTNQSDQELMQNFTGTLGVEEL